MIFVSQSKPSIYGRANWYYEFFHTIAGNTMDKISDEKAIILLIDYVTKRYAKLGHADISWVQENSSRKRKKQGLVTDFVVRESDGRFYLEPSLAGTGLYRDIEVIRW